MTTQRKLGIAAVAAMTVAWGLLLHLQASGAACAPSMRLISWLILLLSLAAPISIFWAALRDRWLWIIGLLPATLLLLSVLGTFEGC